MANWLKLKDDNEESREHRALLARILKSHAFHKSTRSRQLLEFLGKHHFDGRDETIHESRIGAELFGRGIDFDPAEDSIVRSSMRQLRARLADYYTTEGADEAWEVQIPKGSYRTVFQRRSPATSQEDPVAGSLAETEAQQPVAPAVTTPMTSRTPPPVGTAWRPGAWVGILALLVLAFLAGFAANRQNAGGIGIRPTPAQAASRSLFEEFLGDTEGRVSFIPSDSVINLMRVFKGSRINLDEYRTKRAFDLKHPAAAAAPRMWSAIVTRELLNIGDATIVMRAIKENPAHSDRIFLRQARDLQARDLRMGNYVFLGSSMADPWVQVFERHLTFHLVRPADGGAVLWQNREPRDGEPEWFPTRQPYSKQKRPRSSYAQVAVVPNLSGSGKVLLVAGLLMPDTESAGEFVLSPNSASVIASALGVEKLSDAPYFEVMLRTEESARLSKVASVEAYRIINPSISHSPSLTDDISE